jgi:ATP-dependent RNA circularization protein (DNA/RNA ligase family)
LGPQGEDVQKLSEYEQNAAECRQKAAQSTDLQQKKQLEEMAEVWDRLARERRQGVVENDPDQALGR